MTASSNKPPRLFTFASGGWVLLLTALLSIALIAWAVAPAIMRSVYHPPGDGKTIESYQFDLGNLLIPQDEIHTLMIHRDMVPVMVNPTSTGPAEPGDIAADDDGRWRAMQKRNDPKYGKYLVSNDLVIGVALNGQARCYPMRVMNVHEIINDTLGEPPVPIAVTYHWPSDSVSVFDRRINDTTLEFGVSGLIYNCNLLMYDLRRDEQGRQAVGGESLFSQLLAQGVSGDYSGSELNLISASLTTWSDWSTLHPDTTVLDRDLSMAKKYKDASPAQYLRDPRPLRQVKPRSLPADDGAAHDQPELPAKSRVVIVQTDTGGGPRRAVIPLSALDANADKDGQWITTVNDEPVRCVYNRTAQTVRIEPADSSQRLITQYALWFAWQAMHPADPVVVR